MKDFTIAIIILSVLVILFSCFYNSVTTLLYGEGMVPKYKGESDFVIVGDGDAFVNTQFMSEQHITESTAEVIEETNANSDKKQEQNNIVKALGKLLLEEVMEEFNKMDMDNIIAFWHGIAALLLGEASAIAVAAIWTKIKGDK
jgi:hypothetical protein